MANGAGILVLLGLAGAVLVGLALTSRQTRPVGPPVLVPPCPAGMIPCPVGGAWRLGMPNLVCTTPDPRWGGGCGPMAM